MSAILSADDLNDFISPGVACIKPVETLPKQQPEDEPTNEYEVTTEEKVARDNPPPAQISLTDCLACSGCVTSAEAVLVSLQSHSEVLDTLDKYRELKAPWLASNEDNGAVNGHEEEVDGRIFVATVSPQSRASLAATYNVSEREAGFMIAQLLSGPYGLRAGGKHGSGFTWILDTNALREACLVASADEVQQVLDSPAEGQKKPVLNSTCPGWVCYAEKTHPHILPHLSTLKSPQALSGTLIKSVLAKKFGVPPEKVWHLAIMPCFDKKLEASRQELTSHTWHGQDGDAIRDVDCVITARELLMLAESRDISFPCLPKQRLSKQFAPSFPDATINRFLFGRQRGQKHKSDDIDPAAIGTSGGYLHHVLKTQQSRNPGSTIKFHRGRNPDVADYTVTDAQGKELFRAARYYGFRNIQNLVRRLKPAKQSRMPGATRRPMGASRKPGAASAGAASEGDYSYVEVMACPGGCTNGGGQIKVGDVFTLRQTGGTGIENGSAEQEVLPAQKEWLAKVDEAYWSAESEDLEDDGDLDGDGDVEMSPKDSLHDDDNSDQHIVDGIDRRRIQALFEHWEGSTGVELRKLLFTTFRAVESDVGKDKAKGSDVERVAGLAVQVGGGW
jgi:iron only hydrogenase large subunit-like protein